MSDDSYNNDYFGMEDDTYGDYEQPVQKSSASDYDDDSAYGDDRGAKIKEIGGKIKDFCLNIFDKLKNMDRKNLIILICIVVAVLIILISLIKGLSSRHRNVEETDVTAPPVVEQTSGSIPAPITQYNAVNSGDTGFYTVVDTDSLNLRETPNTDHDPITEIDSGDVVEVLYVEEIDGEKWARVDYNGTRGWVMMTYLQAGGTPDATTKGAAG